MRTLPRIGGRDPGLPARPFIILGVFPRYPPRQAVSRTRYSKSRNRTCPKRGAFFLPASGATSSYKEPVSGFRAPFPQQPLRGRVVTVLCSKTATTRHLSYSLTLTTSRYLLRRPRPDSHLHLHQ